MNAPQRAQDAYASVNDVRLHYVAQGHGPLILFLHGFPEFWYGWKELQPDFAEDHCAVAVDMRGYNLSSAPQGLDAYRVPVLVEDVRALAEHLGANKFVLVGHDWGGVVAWAFAATYPDKLEALVILNAPHPAVFARELASNPEQQKASAYFNLFASSTAEAMLAQNEYGLLQQVVFAGDWATDEDRQKYLECWRRGLTGGLNYYRAAGLKVPMRVEDADASRLPLPTGPIAVPTLVIWGEKDIALLTGNLDGLQEHVKSLTVVRIPEAGHFVMHEQPVKVIRAVREFLATASRAPRSATPAAPPRQSRNP